MTKNVISVAAEDTVTQAAELRSERKISSVLIQHGGEFKGILTDRDIIARIVSKGLDPNRVRVVEVMSSPIVTIRDEQTVDDAAADPYGLISRWHMNQRNGNRKGP